MRIRVSSTVQIEGVETRERAKTMQRGEWVLTDVQIDGLDKLLDDSVATLANFFTPTDSTVAVMEKKE